jgi:hypothetical protein
MADPRALAILDAWQRELCQRSERQLLIFELLDVNANGREIRRELELFERAVRVVLWTPDEGEQP